MISREEFINKLRETYTLPEYGLAVANSSYDILAKELEKKDARIAKLKADTERIIYNAKYSSQLAITIWEKILSEDDQFSASAETKETK